MHYAERGLVGIEAQLQHAAVYLHQRPELVWLGELLGAYCNTACVPPCVGDNVAGTG